MYHLCVMYTVIIPVIKKENFNDRKCFYLQAGFLKLQKLNETAFELHEHRNSFDAIRRCDMLM